MKQIKRSGAKSMTALLVTGRAAAGAVREQAEACPMPARVHVCDADVASLLSVEAMLDELKDADLSDVSMIIVPGSAKGDASFLAARLKIPCFKGPRNVSDLPAVLRAVEAKKAVLSARHPAGDTRRRRMRSEALKELELARKPGKYLMDIGSRNTVRLGGGISHVVAEINDAVNLPYSEVMRKAMHYLSSGAKIIDLGMPFGEDNSGKIPGLIEFLRPKIAAPISIDSLNEKDILSAADAGIDLVLSIDASNCGTLDSLSVPVVVVPRDSRGVVPAGWKEKEAVVEGILEKTGNGKVVIDPILSPLNCGFTRSLEAYMHFRKDFPGRPLMLGAGNVTELLDADSVGANALLAGFASELSIELLFTTEASQKTLGSVGELSAAAAMMYLAKKREQPPKDLPLDLLLLKDKRAAEEVCPPAGIRKVNAKMRAEKLEDAAFRIYNSGRRINAVFYGEGKPRLRVTCRSAKEVYQELIGRRLTADLSHAAYLGKELSKAEIALTLGKSYVQDEELFPSVKERKLFI